MKMHLYSQTRSFRSAIIGVSALATASLFSTGLVAEEVSLITNQDTYIYSYQPDDNFGSGTRLQVSARQINYARKGYLGFDLSSTTPGATFGENSALSVTLSPNPLLGDPNGLVTINVYGITDSTAQFDEMAITWNNAPKNNTATATQFESSGVALLGTIDINSSAPDIGDTTVTLSGSGLTEYLNWAVGNLGDHYGTGATQADGKKITLMLAIDSDYAGPEYPGFYLYSSNVSPSEYEYRPELTLDVIPEPSSSAFAMTALLAVSLIARRFLKRK